jgi:serine protease Do
MQKKTMSAGGAWGAVGVAAAILAVAAPAGADSSVWTEKKGAARVALPSLAPLVQAAEPAVLSLFVESTTNSAADPRMDFFRRFGMEIPDFRRQGQGTGFLIHPDGFALTNHHVVEGASKIQVRVGGASELVTATVVGEDPRTDVALIRLDNDKRPRAGWPHLPLGDSDALLVGDFVVAIGNPFGLSQSVSMGILSAKGRRDIAPSGRQGLYDFLQTDASINPGNSGGPLLNMGGEVIGINSAINAAGQGIGFAIPINFVKKLVPDLKAKGRVERAWLGVSIQRVTPELAEGLGLKRPQGALVAQVLDRSPAFKAGLKPGDVITKFDGKEIADSSDLPLLASTAGIGRAVGLELVRGGELRSANVTLAALPDSDGAERPSASDKATEEQKDPGKLGVRVDDLDDELRGRLELPARQRGAVIVRVQPGSAAAAAGLRPGDVVVEVNTARIADAKGFVAAVNKVASGKLLRLLVLRNGTLTFVGLVKP